VNKIIGIAHADGIKEEKGKRKKEKEFKDAD
jgi:hypothetical protein